MFITLNEIKEKVDNRELPLDINKNIDDNKISIAINRANTIIESYLLTAKITEPDQKSIEFMKYVAIDLVRYYLCDSKITDELQSKYNEAIKLLKDVSNGKLRLGEQSKGSSNEPGKQKKTGMFNVRIVRS